MNAQTLRQQIDAADHLGADVFFDALCSFYKDWQQIDALDMFARTGDLTVSRYHTKLDIAALDLWELNGEHREALEAFAPREIRIGCSFDGLKHCMKTYDLVVVDSPQGVYRDGKGVDRIEHFGVLPNLSPILKDKSIVVFYVNKKPYNKTVDGHYGNDSYEAFNFERWMAGRETFYGVRDAQEIRETDALNAYSRLFEMQRFLVKNVLVTPCLTGLPGLPPSFRVAYELERRK